jgi:hypothetical protein
MSKERKGSKGSPEGSPRTDATPILCIISRMNPPTIGHFKLMMSMFRRAKQLEHHTVYVILSNSFDDKNPLSLEQRTAIIEQFARVINRVLGTRIHLRVYDFVNPNDPSARLSPVNGINHIVGDIVSTTGNTVSTPFAVRIFAGSDREGGYVPFGKYMGRYNIESFKEAIEPRPDIPKASEEPTEFDEIPTDPNRMRATYIRMVARWRFTSAEEAIKDSNTRKIEKLREMYSFDGRPMLSDGELQMIIDAINEAPAGTSKKSASKSGKGKGGSKKTQKNYKTYKT